MNSRDIAATAPNAAKIFSQYRTCSDLGPNTQRVVPPDVPDQREPSGVVYCEKARPDQDSQQRVEVGEDVFAEKRQHNKRRRENHEKTCDSEQNLARVGAAFGDHEERRGDYANDRRGHENPIRKEMSGTASLLRAELLEM
jgi:hypothetical protein